MRIAINQQCKTPYFRQITNQIKAMILKGEIPDGTMLPSERAMAELCKVHRNTVIKAYHELKADGFITSSQGKGYMTVYRQQEENHDPESVNWESRIRPQIQDMDTVYDLLFLHSYDKEKISFAGGMISPEIYTSDTMNSLQRILAQRSQNQPLLVDAYNYSHHQGMIDLRNQLALFFLGKGIQTTARQIQVVADSIQAIDFLAEMLLEEGDVVFVEEPTVPDLYRSLQLKNIKIVTVPLDEQGIVVDVMESMIRKHHPKLICVHSGYQNPSGVSTILERRKALLQLSYRYGIPILESDDSSELYFGDSQPVSYLSLDQKNSVVSIYSFDLTFTPGVRIACVLGPRQVIDNMSKIVAMRLTCFDSLSQMVLNECLRSGIYEKALKKMRESYRKKRDLMVELLQPLFDMGAQCHIPEGGVYLWVQLPEDLVRADKVKKCAEKKNILIVPGFLFFPYGTGGEEYMRLNYSFPSEEEIRTGIPKLIEAVKEAQTSL
ncbi:MAG: PLP-dependent aminotransferase family protein [Firmicutes bacterium]|nr:PLP-dependent aminotransferase family protein [Bacillota bacterium]